MNDQPPTANAAAAARRIRGHVVTMSHAARAAHLGSSLSCVDILVALYWNVLQIDPQQPKHPARDRCILSKGHASSALYATLAERGFFPTDELATYGRETSRLVEQMSPGLVPGIEAATGSLGHGLPLGTGIALAAQLQQQNYRVWVVLSDGECNEGSVWEAAMFAASRRLSNLGVIVDNNRWQATGRSNEVLALEPLDEKWAAFGFAVQRVNGHDIAALTTAMQSLSESQGPVAIIADTVKGRGVSFMEDDNNWHYRIPTADEVRRAHEELQLVSIHHNHRASAGN